MLNESPQLYIVKQYSWEKRKKNTELTLEIEIRKIRGSQNPYHVF